MRSRRPRAPASRSHSPPRLRAPASAPLRARPCRSSAPARAPSSRARAATPSSTPADPVQQSFTVGPGAPTLSPQTISFTSTAPGGAVVGGARLHGRGLRELGARRRLHDRVGQRGRVHDLGRHRLARRRRHLHDQREPGRQRELRPRTAGAAVVLGRDAAARVADDQLHLGRARLGRVRRRVLHGRGDGELRPPCRLLGSAEQRGCLHRLGIDGGARRRRHVHDQRESGRQRLAPRGAAGAAVVHRRPCAADDHDHVDAAGGRQAQPAVHDHGNGHLGPRVTFSIAPSSSSVCSISGSSVSFKKHGDCIVRANQAGNANYLPAPQAQQVITVVNRLMTGAPPSPDRGRPPPPDRPMRRQASRDERDGERTRFGRPTAGETTRRNSRCPLRGAGLPARSRTGRRHRGDARPQCASEQLAGAHDGARGRRPRRRLLVRVAARQPARAGDAARHLAPAAARRRHRKRGRGAQDRRRAPRADRSSRTFDRHARRVAADRLDGHDHRRGARARHRHDRAAARRRGSDAAPPGGAAAHARRPWCSCGTAA